MFPWPFLIAGKMSLINWYSKGGSEEFSSNYCKSSKQWNQPGVEFSLVFFLNWINLVPDHLRAGGISIGKRQYKLLTWVRYFLKFASNKTDLSNSYIINKENLLFTLPHKFPIFVVKFFFMCHCAYNSKKLSQVLNLLRWPSYIIEPVEKFKFC